MTTDKGETFLTSAELAKRWKISPLTIANWRHKGTCVIPSCKINNRVLYRLKDVEEYEKNNTG